MELIRTGYRDKLPRGLSYPVGAEAISEALVGVPQFYDLWIAFTKTGWMEISTNPKQVISFMRTFAANLNFYNGGASFGITVPAIPSDYRQLVRKAIIDYGLPAIKIWLATPRSPTWCEGYREITVGVEINREAICLVEKMNEQIVSFKQVQLADKL